MLQVDMSASKRENFGKCAMRRLRVSGNTPAVLYGNNKDVTALQLETVSFTKSLFQISRKNAVVNLSIDGNDTRHVMVKEIQTDPVDDGLVHADFYEIDLSTPKSFTVPVEFTGKAKGEDLGGEILIHNANVVLEGLPLDVPDTVTLDVSDLGIGDSIETSVIELPENVKMKTDGSSLCVEVVTAIASES
ncbi:MAG TPA: 50S ribosomal protein L25 [Desulfobacterales bacterium]|nr:50S ribosomal protein L25 [Desulfobacterales bacterium]HIP40500.1 50S ribosomal protein L25 [Desulfocapsa sulfexigens]